MHQLCEEGGRMEWVERQRRAQLAGQIEGWKEGIEGQMDRRDDGKREGGRKEREGGKDGGMDEKEGQMDIRMKGQ